MQNPLDKAVFELHLIKMVIHARSVALKVVNRLLDGINKIETPQQVETLLVVEIEKACAELSKEVRHQFTVACEVMEKEADKRLEKIVKRNMGDNS